MMEKLDRNALIELLDKLGDENDEEALATARRIHAEVAGAGSDWDRLLVGEAAAADADEAIEGDADEAIEGDADEAFEDDGNETDDAPAVSVKSMDDKEALALIERLLGRSGISQDLREELRDYKEDIAEGEFQASDGTYLQALNARLAKKS